jgi:hypothetical protein
MMRGFKKIFIVLLFAVFGFLAFQPLASTSYAATKSSQTTTSDEQNATKETVDYVTKTGHKYHRAGCRYLRRSSIPMPLKEAKKLFTPCSVCNPAEE